MSRAVKEWEEKNQVASSALEALKVQLGEKREQVIDLRTQNEII